MKQQIPALRGEKTKKKSNKMVVILVMSFFLILFVILFLKSPLNKVSAIQVEGNELLTEQEIMKQSAVALGAPFLSLSPAKIEANLAEIDLVKEAEVTKRFPGLVMIRVVEFERVAFQEDGQGKLRPVLADGSLLTSKNGPFVFDRPILTGWAASGMDTENLSIELAKLSPAELMAISEIKPNPSKSYPDKITLFMRDGYEVQTTVSFLEKKMKLYDVFVAELKKDNLPLGYIYMLETDYFEPYKQDQQPSNGRTDKENKGNDEKETTQ